jgi:hypothetical protein
MLALKR